MSDKMKITVYKDAGEWLDDEMRRDVGISAFCFNGDIDMAIRTLQWYKDREYTRMRTYATDGRDGPEVAMIVTDNTKLKHT